MATVPDPLDPFGLNQRDPERDPANGPPVPNMGGIPQTPIPPSTDPFSVMPVAADQGGRPAEPTAPSPATPLAAAPAAPQAPKEPEQKPGAAGVTINVGSASGGQATPKPVAPTPTPTGLPAPIPLNRLPTVAEMDFSPPGSTFETPIGTITKDQVTGQSKVQLNEAGMVKYKEAKARSIQAFGGYPLAGMPGAPLPPVEPGQPAFNPFMGTWLGTED